MPAKTSSNLEIAKRANAHARADFATWQMMARLRSTDALPLAAQEFYAQYHALRERSGTPDEAAAEATIALVYARYYTQMGGTGKPPRIAPAPVQPPAAPSGRGDNVTPFRRIKPAASAPVAAKKRPAVPALVIFAGLVAVAVLVQYLRGGF